MLIDKTYFVGKLSIPHLSISEGVNSSLSNLADLERYISIYEPEFLEKLLGEAYPDYVANPTETEWTDFIALIRNTTTLVSPIANYVFFKSYPDIVEKNTGIGTVQAVSENSVLVTDSRLINVWNDMIHQLYKTDGVLDYLSTTIFDGDYASPDWSNFTTINQFGI